MRISSLHIYPVKSTRGHSIDFGEIDALGMVGDRRAAFLDTDGNVLEQRDTPMLARITARETAHGLLISMEGQDDIVARPAEWQVCVKVWEGYGKAFLADEAANEANLCASPSSTPRMLFRLTATGTGRGLLPVSPMGIQS